MLFFNLFVRPVTSMLGLIPMLKKRITMIAFSTLILYSTISTITAIHFFQQEQYAWNLYWSEQNNVFWHILSDNTEKIKYNYINNMSDGIISCDQILVGEGRLQVLWMIKNIVVKHNIKIGKESSSILANLPAQPLSSCQVGEKCELHPSNMIGFPVMPNQSLHGSGPQ